jgi:formylglycine-generating enzyme required for sulfatase activity
MRKHSSSLLPLCGLFLVAAATGQTGRSMRLQAPAVLGYTAGFALQHPAAIAGNLYALMLSSPTWPQAVTVTVPGLSVNGLLRLDMGGLVVGTVGLLGASGQTATLPMPIPNNLLLLGFSFDVQGFDVDASGVLTLSDDDLEIAVSAPPPASLNLIAITAGTFQMGSVAVGPPATPVHAVTISRPFWIGRHEVTQAQYQAVTGTNPSIYQGSNRPVENVNWFDAVAYCDALSVQEAAAGRLPSGYEYRLPTEAEWEYCCRAGTTTEWNVGSSLSCSQANFFTPPYCVPPGQTSVVGSYAANAWGLLDTHGNVWEWCLDGWDGSANYPAGPVTDPYALSSSAYQRVQRGGSWNDYPSNARSAFRYPYSPFTAFQSIGLRVVCAPILP